MCILRSCERTQYNKVGLEKHDDACLERNLLMKVFVVLEYPGGSMEVI
jgi:hypothetical protein